MNHITEFRERLLPRPSRATAALLLALSMTCCARPSSGAELPEVRVTNVRRVFHNGEHNAFTSYPGFVELSPTRAVMSWYSSHEKDSDGKTLTAIYMADLEVLLGDRQGGEER